MPRLTPVKGPCIVCRDDVYPAGTIQAKPARPGPNELVLPCGHPLHRRCLQEYERNHPQITECFYKCVKPINRDFIQPLPPQPSEPLVSQHLVFPDPRLLDILYPLEVPFHHHFVQPLPPQSLSARIRSSFQRGHENSFFVITRSVYRLYLASIVAVSIAIASHTAPIVLETAPHYLAGIIGRNKRFFTNITTAAIAVVMSRLFRDEKNRDRAIYLGMHLGLLERMRNIAGCINVLYEVKSIQAAVTALDSAADRIYLFIDRVEMYPLMLWRKFRQS